jgi:hypothetical protein
VSRVLGSNFSGNDRQAHNDKRRKCVKCFISTYLRVAGFAGQCNSG